VIVSGVKWSGILNLKAAGLKNGSVNLVEGRGGGGGKREQPHAGKASDDKSSERKKFLPHILEESRGGRFHGKSNRGRA